MNKITICRLCSGQCLVNVKIDKHGQLTAERIKSSKLLNSVSCPRLEAINEIIYSPKRVTNPMVKVKKSNSQFEWQYKNWDDILTVVASKLNYFKETYGPESVCWIRGQAADWGSTWHYAMRLMNLFGSPNIIGNGAVCHAAREFPHIITYGEMSSPDYKNAKCIIVWGRNDYNTKLRAFENLLYAKNKGAKLIVIDPVKTELAKIADRWIQIRPGQDGLLAMALINVIINENLYDKEFVDHWTIGFSELSQEIKKYSPDSVSDLVQIDAQQIREIARIYAKTKPACIGDGNGIDMHLNVFQTSRAICILRAITGNLDKKGGDYLPQAIPFKNIQLEESLHKNITPITYQYPLFSHFRATRGNPTLGAVTDAILKKDPYPIKALIIQGSNPVLTVANTNRFLKALDSLEYIIVIDLFMTQTAKLADVFLPTTTSFETTRINFGSLYGNHVILQDKVIEPLGNSWPDWKITFELGRKLGFKKEFPWREVEEAIDNQLQPTGITVENLRDNPKGIDYEKIKILKYLSENFHTSSGKVEILSELLVQYGYNPIPSFPLSTSKESYSEKKDQYPLLAITGARPKYFVHSQLRNIQSLLNYEPEPFVDINSIDARNRNIRDGQQIKIITPNGQVIMKAKISDVISPGIIRIAWGWGETGLQNNVNNLTDDTEKDPITSTTSNRSFMCNIVK